MAADLEKAAFREDVLVLAAGLHDKQSRTCRYHYQQPVDSSAPPSSAT